MAKLFSWQDFHQAMLPNDIVVIKYQHQAVHGMLTVKLPIDDKLFQPLRNRPENILVIHL